MLNNSGQDWLVLSQEDGEHLFTIRKGESVNVRSILQARNDKFLSKKIRIKGEFIKVMDREKEIAQMLLKYPTTYSALNIMKSSLVYNENVLVNEKGTKYKGTDLAKEMGITRQSAMAHLKRLQDLGLIAEVETKKGKFWAINPNYYLRGETVSERVIKAFEKQKKEK